LLKRRPDHSGFTIIELLIIVAIIGILAAIAIPRYTSMVVKSKDASTKGNLATIRSSLSVYYGDNEQVYPSDDLASLVTDGRYLPMLPQAKLAPNHVENDSVVTEVAPTESGNWSYNNDSTTDTWGHLHAGCFHDDYHGYVWSAF
jgi:type IV pilus assembly protein PilA